MAKTIEEQIKDFFENPKNSKQAEVFRGLTKQVLSEVAEEERKKTEEDENKEEPGLLDFLFGNAKKKKDE